MYSHRLYHAEVAYTDPFSDIGRFKYKIALPAPALYGQFKTSPALTAW